MVSATTQLKLTASDGKKYKTDVISQAGVEQLAKSIRNQRAMVFLDWFKYSENTIDGRSKKCVDWSKIDKKEYLEAMRRSTTDAQAIKSLFQGAMTDRIDDREIFMKGIDYSYYYEQEDEA